MNAVHQIIPQQHIASFLKSGFYFAPCRTFIDQLEFRFGYCGYKTGAMWPAMEQCVRETFSDGLVNNLINTTCVSCWTEDPAERYAMWEIYGRREASIRVSIDRKKLTALVGQKTDLPGMSGSVRYSFFISSVRPEFLAPFNHLPEQQQEDYLHLFFHKHDHYKLEDEFRVIVASEESLTVPFDPTLVNSITLSPFGTFKEEVIAQLEQRFGGRVKRSSLSNPY